jgi:hypothetical protein
VVATTGTATTAIIIGITTTTIIIGTGQAIPGITAIGKAPARANEPEDLNLRLFLRHNRGNAYWPCLAHDQAGFKPLLYGIIIALILKFFLTETGPANKET